MMMMFLVAQAEGASGGMGSLGAFVPFILIFAIFYFLMIRPQQRKDKERRKQIEALTAGKRIVFAGGIIGVIKEMKEATFKVEIANGVVVEIARGAVNRVLSEGEAISAEDNK